MVEWRRKMDTNTWEIHAVRYAHHERGARENFMAGDPHDDSPMPLDYYVWTLRSNGRTFVIDTGFATIDFLLVHTRPR